MNFNPSALYDVKSLIILGGTTLVCIATGELWIILLGIVFYVISVVFGSQGQVEDLYLAQTFPKELLKPQAARVLGKNYNNLSAVQMIVQNVLNEIKSSDRTSKATLAPIVLQIRELLDKYFELAQGVVLLRAQLQPGKFEELSDRKRQHQEQLDRIDDSITRSNLQQTIASLDSRLESIADLQAGEQRILSHMDSIEAGLENLSAQVVKIKTVKLRGVDFTSIDSMQHNLQDLLQKTESVASSLDEAFQARRDPVSQ